MLYRTVKMFKKGSFAGLAAVLLLAAVPEQTQAQLKFPGTGYFQNQYLLNPAMAGINQKRNISLAYGKQWHDVPGSPVNMSLTADLGFSGNMGAGLQVSDDKAGILQRSKIMASYAYHVPFSQTHNLHLGFSVGAVSEKVDMGAINGESGDPLLAGFNDRGAYFEADFGAAYTFNNKLTIQGAIPNLVSQFSKSEGPVVENTTYFAAIGYKTKLNMDAGAEPIGIEPKLGIRGFKGYDPIFDAGANFTVMDELLNITAMYHTSQSFTFGVGVNLKLNLSAVVLYQTKPGDIRGMNTGESFDFGLKYSF